MDMTEIVMGHFVGEDEGDLLICWATFVQSPLKVNVTARGGKGRDLVQPGNRYDEAFRFRASGLKAGLHPLNPLERPSLRLELDGFAHLVMEPFAEASSIFNLKVTSHIKEARSPTLV
jgi:hypothetical protein